MRTSSDKASPHDLHVTHKILTQGSMCIIYNQQASDTSMEYIPCPTFVNFYLTIVKTSSCQDPCRIAEKSITIHFRLRFLSIFYSSYKWYQCKI